MKTIGIFVAISASFIFSTTLILDTNLKARHNYASLAEKLERVGQPVEYTKFHDELDYSRFDAIFFVASSEFLESQPSPLTRCCIKQLKKFIKGKDKALAIVIEPAQARSAKLLLTRLKINFNPCKLALQAPTYDTALFCASEEQPLPTLQAANATALPMEQSYLHELASFLPVGYLLERNCNRKIFVTTASKLLFNEIQENFRTTPTNPKILQSAEQAILDSLATIFNKQPTPATSTPDILRSLDYAQDRQDPRIRAKLRRAWQDERSCKTFAAWMDLKDWDQKELEKLTQLLEQTRIDLLWVRFNPERYLAKNGIDKNQKEQLFRLTKNLTEALSKLEMPPKLYVGCELTSNFRNIKPAATVKDIYGQKYPNIPSPFDFENLWQAELIEPIKQLVAAWPEVGNGVPIVGIFLDLEMYHAQQQLADYSSTTVPETTCITNKNLNEQINLLKREAFDVGTKVSSELGKVDPNLKVGIYMQTLPGNWFYEQLLAGISSKEQITLATFNVQYQKHKQALKDLGINAEHLTVAMLSKFRPHSNPDINRMLTEHDGIWLNRFNRLIEPYEDDKWWSLEASQISSDIPKLIAKAKP